MDWVPVAEGWGVGKEVEILAAMIANAGVPAELSYRPFAEKIGWPFGSLTPARILVPPEHAPFVRELIAAEPDAPWRVQAEEELAELGGGRAWSRVSFGYALLTGLVDPPYLALALAIWLRDRLRRPGT